MCGTRAASSAAHVERSGIPPSGTQTASSRCPWLYSRNTAPSPTSRATRRETLEDSREARGRITNVPLGTVLLHMAGCVVGVRFIRPLGARSKSSSVARHGASFVAGVSLLFSRAEKHDWPFALETRAPCVMRLGTCRPRVLLLSSDDRNTSNHRAGSVATLGRRSA